MRFFLSKTRFGSLELGAWSSKWEAGSPKSEAVSFFLSIAIADYLLLIADDRTFYQEKSNSSL